jgi:hypothetical protein
MDESTDLVSSNFMSIIERARKAYGESNPYAAQVISATASDDNMQWLA